MNKIRGTVAELVNMGLKINGEAMNQGTLSTLTRLGLAKKVGEAEKKGNRGKAATVWEMDSTITLNLNATLGGTNTVEQAEPAEAAE